MRVYQAGRIIEARPVQRRIAADFHSAVCDVEECATPIPAGSVCYSLNGKRGCTSAHCELAFHRQRLGV